MQPTPWTPAEIPDSSSDLLLRRARRSVGAAASALAGRGAGVCIVVGGLATLMLLFQPWLVAGGYDGTGQVNAFGTLRATTTYLNYWSSAPPPGVKISGLWGLLAAGAAVVAVLAAAANLRYRAQALARVATVATLLGTVFVLTTVAYLSSKGPELKTSLSLGRDVGGQLGSMMSWAFGNSNLVLPGIRRSGYASASLTGWALSASVTSLASALAAALPWLRTRRRPQAN